MTGPWCFWRQVTVSADPKVMKRSFCSWQNISVTAPGYDGSMFFPVKLSFSPIDSWVFFKNPPKEGPEPILKANGHEGLPGIYIYICNTCLHGRSPSWFIKGTVGILHCSKTRSSEKSTGCLLHLLSHRFKWSNLQHVWRIPYFNRSKTSFPHPPARRLAWCLDTKL